MSPGAIRASSCPCCGAGGQAVASGNPCKQARALGPQGDAAVQIMPSYGSLVPEAGLEDRGLRPPPPRNSARCSPDARPSAESWKHNFHPKSRKRNSLSQPKRCLFFNANSPPSVHTPRPVPLPAAPPGGRPQPTSQKGHRLPSGKWIQGPAVSAIAPPGPAGQDIASRSPGPLGAGVAGGRTGVHDP